MRSLHSSRTRSLREAYTQPGSLLLRKPLRARQALQPRRSLCVEAFWHASTPPVPLARRYLSKMAQRFHKARRSPNGETSVSQVYPDANTKEPKEYWEYETLTVSWGYVAPHRFDWL